MMLVVRVSGKPVDELPELADWHQVGPGSIPEVLSDAEVDSLPEAKLIFADPVEFHSYLYHICDNAADFSCRYQNELNLN